MNTIRNVYRRLDRLQQKLSFKIVASCVVLIWCGLLFGSLVITSTSLDVQRRALLEALTGQSYAERDEHAVTLHDSGIVYLNGRTYGGERFAERPDMIFDDGGEGVIMAPAVMTEALLRDSYPPNAPKWLLEQPGTTWMLALLTTAWLLLIVWMAITVPFVLTFLGTAAAVGAAWLFNSQQTMYALAGIGLLTFTFVLLSRLAQLLLHRPNQMLAVAHTVLKEASRTKIPLVFIVLILILLPLLPIWLDPSSPLRFQIQTFIARSLGFTFYLAACMTLFLSCATVAFEIRDRQIWQLMTKPVGRLNYLLGKWLGVITVNLIIMVIAAVSIFTFIQYLREQPVAQGLIGQEDRQQVRDAVLTARVGGAPTYETLTEEQIRQRVDAELLNNPDYAGLEEVPQLLRRKLRIEIEHAFAVGQRSIPPFVGNSPSGRTYTFENLAEARDSGSTLTLRYRFHILADDEHETFPALFIFNEDPNYQVSRTYVPTMTHVLSIPADIIRDDGTLSVTIVNLYQPPMQRRMYGALNFEEDDFELLYKVGGFEANFLRAVVVQWFKLAFLAMLGICCATFLSFPVACLMSFTIFIAGTLGPYLATSLEEYYPPSTAAMDWTNIGLVIQWAFQNFIRAIAQALVYLLRAFGEFHPTQSLIEGRLIPWSTVVWSFLRIGALWSGLSLLVGYIVIRKRQLAIYSGHG